MKIKKIKIKTKNKIITKNNPKKEEDTLKILKVRTLKTKLQKTQKNSAKITKVKLNSLNKNFNKFKIKIKNLRVFRSKN